MPLTHDYLQLNKEYLQMRERGKMKGDNWYGYVYPKNLEVMQSAKILVPDIVDRAAFALDNNARYAFTSGYGITLKATMNVSLLYVLAVLNSRAANYFIKRVSTPMRGGFFRYFTQFLEQVPMPKPDQQHHDRLVALAEQISTAKKKRADAITDRDITFFDRQIASLDRQIDSIVYELYALTDADIALVENDTGA